MKQFPLVSTPYNSVPEPNNLTLVLFILQAFTFNPINK